MSQAPSQGAQPHLPETVRAALAASAANDVEQAIRLLRQASAEDSSSALPQFLLGAELAQAGRIEEAEAAYANAVLLAPDFHIARFELGSLQFTSGRAAIALVTWQPLLRLPADDALRLFAQGYAELAADKFEPALAAFHAGIKANRENEPLNGNIRMLIEGIEKLRGAGTQAPAAEATTGSHVLMNAYRNGPMH